MMDGGELSGLVDVCRSYREVQKKWSSNEVWVLGILPTSMYANNEHILKIKTLILDPSSFFEK